MMLFKAPSGSVRVSGTELILSKGKLLANIGTTDGTLAAGDDTRFGLVTIHEATYDHSSFVSGTELNYAVKTKMDTHESTFNHNLIVDTSNLVSGTELNSAVTSKMLTHETTYNHNLIVDTSNFVSGTELNYAVKTKMDTHESTFNHNLIVDTSNFVSGTELNIAVANKMNTHETAYQHNTFASGTELNEAVINKMLSHETTYLHNTFASGTELNTAVTNKMSAHESTYDHTSFVSGTELNTAVTTKMATHEATYNHGTFVSGTELNYAVTTKLYDANHVIIPNGIGSPSLDDLQDWFNNTRSAGRISGGAVSAHSPNDGNVDLSELTGMIFTTDSQGGNIVYFRKPAVSNAVAVGNNTVSWVYMDYDSGNLTYKSTQTRETVHQYDQFVVGRVWCSGLEVEVMNSGHSIYNSDRRNHNRLIDKYGDMDHSSGAVLAASGGTRTISVSNGSWYVSNSSYTTSGIDTNLGSTFSLYYRNTPTNWVRIEGQTQVPNTQYNRLSDNTLQNLTVNRYGVYWVFVCPEGRVYLIYGQGDYTSAQAIAAQVPASLPPYCVNWARLIGKIIIQNGASTFTSIETVFGNNFTQSAATWHPDLAGRSEADSHPISAISTTIANGNLIKSNGATLIDGGAPPDLTNYVSGTQLNTAVINKMNIHEATYLHNTFASGTELNTAVTLKMNTHEATYDHSQLANFANLVSGTELNSAVTSKMLTHETTYDHTKIHDAATAGTGISLTGQQVNLYISGLSLENSITATDTIPFLDSSVVLNRKVTATNLAAYIATVVGYGADVQVFTSDGTWTKPIGRKNTRIYGIGPGGGGGSGARTAVGGNESGGGGGASGGWGMVDVPTEWLGDTEAVVIPTGGTGGAVQTVDGQNGNAGGDGGTLMFGSTILVVPGGGGGERGQNASNAGGGTIGALPTCGITPLLSLLVQGVVGGGGNNGGIGDPGTSATTAKAFVGGSGAGGGGITNGNVAKNGGTGGSGCNLRTHAGGSAGTVGAGQDAGTATSTETNAAIGGGGGGGGAGNETAAAGAGSNGGNYGAGGGGGGSSRNGNNSGKGGDGAPGICVVLSW